MVKTVPVTVTLPGDLVKIVDRIARKERISRSTLVSDALKRRAWLWRLAELQKEARPYVAKLGLRSEEDLDRFLNP